MIRASLAELEPRCQKPDHRRVGNWMARRISRPLALRVTWLVAPWGVSADVITLLAWLCGLVAAGSLACGGLHGWLIAAGLLQAWYLLDHVDGQLARYRGTASLDGVQLDYLMHHTLNLLVPLGAGYGLVGWKWQLCGLAWGLALLCLGLSHDTRYKAFVQRLKRVHGELLVAGGAGARPHKPAGPPRSGLQLAKWAARKSCEIHVVMNFISLVALGQWLARDQLLWAGRTYVLLSAILSAVVVVTAIVRANRQQAAEQEFAAWYRVPEGHDLVFDQGWWHVRNEQEVNNF